MTSTARTLDIDKIRQPLYSTHDSGVNLSYEWRVKQLQTLRRLILDNRQLFLETLSDDLGRYPTESVCTECIPIETEVEYMLHNLKEWMKPEHVSTPLLMAPAKAWIESKPLQPPGVLIIGPSNYPLQLCLKPLAGVLAGGNPCIIKPRYGPDRRKERTTGLSSCFFFLLLFFFFFCSNVDIRLFFYFLPM
jgi:aldehyde dehydrogenase (NAD+)